MVKLIISYFVSVLIAMAVFTSMYFSVFDTYGGGSFESLGSKKEVMDMLYWPVLPKILLLMAILFAVLIFPLSWISNKKFSEKKMISFGLFILVGLIVAGVSLLCVEPIIATDYFEYRERQELNKVLESIGYGYTNAMIYVCASLVAISSWAITQVQFKAKQN